MNRKPLSRKFGVVLAMVVGALVSACGAEDESTAAASSGQELAEAKRGEGAMYICDTPIPPATLNPQAIVVELEMDRVYKSARPGFAREWIPGGWMNGQLFGEILVRFDSAARAREFADWLANDFIVD